jgi:serine/threonine protein kinase
MDAGDVPAGRYRLERVLSRGGMGEVWRAQEESVLRRAVAVKVLHETLADPTATRRFQKEAATLAALQHPGITVVHDAGRHNGHLFIVMELLHGEDLTQLTAQHLAGCRSTRCWICRGRRPKPSRPRTARASSLGT